jgi:dipeptidase D
MSPDVPGLVQTSTNLGMVRTEGGTVKAYFLSRSSIDASKAALTDRIGAACTLAGFGVEQASGYPGWKPEPEAPLVRIVDGVSQELFGAPLKVVAIHAGLECGMIGEKHPGLQMVSIGPNMWDVHTPAERVSVSSVARFWTFLKGVLAAA